MFFMNSVRKAPGVRSAVAGAVVVCLGVGTQAVWAAEQVMETVVVTATRVETPLQKAPVGATVITASDLYKSGVRDANEAVRKLGGVVARSDLSGGRENSLSLRGYGSTAEMNLVVLVNGVRSSEAQLVSARLSAIPINQIERIEIVRGGNSVMWGAGASSGVINVILKNDREQGLHGLAAVSLESDDGYELNGAISQGLEHWWWDANVKRLATDGYRDNGDYRQDVGGVQVGGESGGLSWHARAQQEHQVSGLPGPLSFTQFAQNPRQTNEPLDRAQTDENIFSVGAQWAMRAAKFKVEVASRDRASQYMHSWGTDTWQSKTDQITPTLSHTLQLGSATVDYTAGLVWERWTLSRPSSAASEQTNQAVFAQFNATLPSLTRLTLGARRENASSGSSFGGVSSYDRFDRLHAWELGLSQTVTQGVDLYGRLARSYRLATADEYGFTLNGVPLKPQINRDWELGVKWMSGKQSATARLFRQDTRDEIDYNPITEHNANMAPLSRQGLELEGRWAWGQGWSTMLAGQVIDASFVGGPLAQGGALGGATLADLAPGLSVQRSA